ncbi:YdeI/OmpD-associated family protein [Amnibacterium sp.]|uniref:YdeI/OmpD-associated family protein n=1 Tax=Amnibacterium sp. TaxID=1872496 RepID=UPI0026323CB0|nr:YdeI/OmpD-associated family protein [Amnibacterium sp.]
MPETVRYTTTMALIGRNTGIPVPDDVLDRLGGGRRPPVAVVVNGYRYRGTVGSMGGRSLISFSSDHRARSGIAGDDVIDVELTLDTAPREVAVPDDLGAALEAAGLTEAFGRLAPSHRKAHVTSVEEAKAPETRARRIVSAVEKVRSGS